MTNDRILRQDDQITMKYRADEHAISLVWRGYVPSDAYRSILNEALRNVNELEIIRWIADLRDMDAILQDDEQWTVTNWFPLLAKTDLKRMAILTSSDYFNRMSVDRIMTNGTVDFPLSVGYFDELDKARSWLLSTEEAMEPAY